MVGRRNHSKADANIKPSKVFASKMNTQHKLDDFFKYQNPFTSTRFMLTRPLEVFSNRLQRSWSIANYSSTIRQS
jgi:hypothetical protein